MFQNITQIVKKKILLMIPKGKGRNTKPEGQQWHYFALKKLSALLKRIISKSNGDFYCFNFLYSFRTKNKFESHKRVFENKKSCNVVMPSEDTQYQKSDKASLIIYAHLECIIEKIAGCKNNPENVSTKKVSQHIPSGFSMPAILSFRSIENKNNVYRSNDYMKKVCAFLRKYARK